MAGTHHEREAERRAAARLHGVPGGVEDLYCLGCGYSLRGLPGEQIRCPECGEMNPLSGEPVPARFLERQVRLMARPATFCVICFLMSLVPLAVLVRQVADGRWLSQPETMLCSGFAALLLVMPWFTTAVTFVGQCSQRWGAVKLLALHHVVGLCIPALCIGLWQIDQARLWWGDLLLTPWLSLGMVVVMILGMVMLHRRLRPMFTAAYREEATRRAREDVKQALRASGRK